MKPANSGKHIVMLVAENGALPGGKVGGMGDVIRELPPHLASLGHRVSIVTPAYGFLARLPGTRKLGTIKVPFASVTETCNWLEVPGNVDNVSHQLIDHPRFTPYGTERIYHDDDAGAPFATDATKFAFFCAAAARLIMEIKPAPDVIHLHDWHPSLYSIIRAHDPDCRELRSIRTVLTIHNLAMQGVRPLAETQSSFRRWFPSLDAPFDEIGDPRYADCVNPLATAIRLCDAVTTVSPSYADEIVVAGDPATGRPGGDGLETLLARRRREDALTGILNGCEYPAPLRSKPGWKRLLTSIHRELDLRIAAETFVDSAAWLALRRLQALPRRRPSILATGIGRVTDQKLGLFREASAGGGAAIDSVLRALGDGVLFMLGSGDRDYEIFLQRTMARHENFLFLKGYSDRLSEQLYAGGDLFLMPSVFEPCGISQMLAMRSGQPCVVHAVGGLKDTVDGSTGFPFGGDTRRAQAANLVGAITRAAALKRDSPKKWKAIQAAAARQRFTWNQSAERYAREIYFPHRETAR